MTLDEAIRHAEEVAEEHEKIKRIKAVTLEECNCAEKHRQLAEWLKELKQIKEQQPCEDAISRQKAIDAIDALYLDGDSSASYRADAEGDTLIGKYQAITALDDLPPVTKKSETVTEFADRCRECGAKYGRLLKQEPCGDAISRENTLKAMIEQLGIKNEDYLIPAEATLYKVVKNMPPVQPQSKMGRWIESTGHDDIGQFYTCSECGRYINLICGAKLADYPYCHCGVKMEVEEN